MRHLAIACVLLGLVCGVSRESYAQTARSGGAPNAQLMAQMQQLASERTALQAENAKMKKELEDVKKERDALKKGQQAVGARLQVNAAALARSTQQSESTALELKQTKEKTQELVAKFRETIQTLREVETQGNAAKQSLAAREQDLKECRNRNGALYEINSEVLTHFEHQSMWSRAAAAEPFTKLERVQLENYVDDYRARAEDQRVAPTPASAPATPAPHP